MKSSLIHWSAVLSLLGSSLLGPSMLANTSAIALPPGDVMKQLEKVPLFAVTDAKGALIGRSAPDPKDQSKKVEVATFFVSQQDAQAAVDQLKSGKTEIGKTAKIAPAPLSKIYEIARNSKDKKENLAVSIVPKQQDVDSATALLKQNGQQVQQIDVPLFYGVINKDKQKFYLSLQGENKTSVTPFYFSKQDLQRVLDQLKQKDPKANLAPQIQVTSLSSVITFLEKDNSPLAKQVTLVPSSEALKYVLSQQQPAPQNKVSPPQNQPAPKPAAPQK